MNAGVKEVSTIYKHLKEIENINDGDDDTQHFHMALNFFYKFKKPS